MSETSCSTSLYDWRPSTFGLSMVQRWTRLTGELNGFSPVVLQIDQPLLVHSFAISLPYSKFQNSIANWPKACSPPVVSARVTRMSLKRQFLSQPPLVNLMPYP